ncbi:unnamed protein product [Calypogeia fissa]
MKELILKGAHAGLAESQAPEPVPAQERRRARMASEGFGSKDGFSKKENKENEESEDEESGNNELESSKEVMWERLDCPLSFDYLGTCFMCPIEL